MRKDSIGHVILHNILGVAALFAVHFISDRYAFYQRQGFQQTSPYLFLLIMYGWIVFHNRVLFDKLYLHDKKAMYFMIAIAVMLFSSLNMYLILVYEFQATNILPKIISFWVYTLAGLGVYVMFNYLNVEKETPAMQTPSSTLPGNEATHFECVIDGVKEHIPLTQILYIESLENYIKVVTEKNTSIVRLSLKEAEERLPRPAFIRISRSHIVNMAHSISVDQESMSVRGQQLKIGKVYKRYVMEHL